MDFSAEATATTTHAKIKAMSREFTADVLNLSQSTKLLLNILRSGNEMHGKNLSIGEHLGVIEKHSIRINKFCKFHPTFQSLDNDQYLTISIAIDQLEIFIETIVDMHRADISALESELIKQTHKILSTTLQFLGSVFRVQTTLKIRGVYVIVDPQATKGMPIEEMASSVLRGGANVIQLRDKISDPPTVLRNSKRIRIMCAANDTVFIANDDPHIAVNCNAHGLHLGRDDIQIDKARAILSVKQIIGSSNNNVEDLNAAIAAGSDYLAVGAIFPTESAGKVNRPVVGTQLIEKAKGMCDKPIVAIGGITEKNVGEVARAGADSICVIKSVCGSMNPEESTARLVEAFQTSK